MATSASVLALDANAAKIIAGVVIMGVGGVTLLAPKLQLQSRLVLPTGITFGFFGGILGGIAAMPGPLVFIFLLAKGLRGRAFTKEASLYLVVSAGLLAVLLIASRQFSWLDVSVSTAAMLPVLLGMYVGQHMRDKIAPETFKKLVLIAVIAAGASRVTIFPSPAGRISVTSGMVRFSDSSKTLHHFRLAPGTDVGASDREKDVLSPTVFPCSASKPSLFGEQIER
jgi:uncharacterized membrane protein YfcA